MPVFVKDAGDLHFVRVNRATEQAVTHRPRKIKGSGG